jgi:hypothetical protein
MERERRMTEKQEMDGNINSPNFNKNFTMEFDEKITESIDKKNMSIDINFNLNEMDMDEGKFRKSRAESFNEEDIFDKPYSDFQENLQCIDEILKEKNNHTEILEQNLNININPDKNSKSSSMRVKKPPIPASMNKLYKNADKNMLNKIQRILKNKESNKLNYISSEEEN